VVEGGSAPSLEMRFPESGPFKRFNNHTKKKGDGGDGAGGTKKGGQKCSVDNVGCCPHPDSL